MSVTSCQLIQKLFLLTGRCYLHKKKFTVSQSVNGKENYFKFQRFSTKNKKFSGQNKLNGRAM